MLANATTHHNNTATKRNNVKTNEISINWDNTQHESTKRTCTIQSTIANDTKQKQTKTTNINLEKSNAKQELQKIIIRKIKHLINKNKTQQYTSHK